MAKVSEAHKAANRRYDLKTYEQIRANSRKAERRIERIRQAASAAGVSYQAYIIKAIDTALSADGVTVDILPPAETTPVETTDE